MGADTSLPIELRSATELLALLRTRKLSAIELLERCLARVDRYNRDFNLVVATDIEGARRAARQADEATARGDETGRLHGLPMTLKDVWEVEGMTATCGFPHLANHRPVRDADAVARLRGEGAIFFGKTNVPVGAGDHQSYNPVYGQSNNPWNPSRTVGGSSGGAAGAVAAGLTPLELGSDIGGSIRCPAHFCGVYGHKPSFGLVPMRGHIPPMPGALFAIELGVGGPIARSAQDLELALDVLAAPGELERGALRLEIPPSRQENLRHFRVALWADSTALGVDARCVAAIEEYAADLRRAGVHLERARPDFDPREVYKLYIEVLFSVFSGGMPDDALKAFADAAAGLAPDDDSYPSRIARAVRMSHHGFMALAERREQLFRAWRRFFESHDVLLCPIMPTVAFAHDHSGDEFGHVAQYHRTTLIDGVRRPYLDGLQWPGVITVANLPATALPTGRLIDGLPMGLQVVGPYLEDRTPLRFAQLAEREFGGFVPPPAVRSGDS